MVHQVYTNMYALKSTNINLLKQQNTTESFWEKKELCVLTFVAQLDSIILPILVNNTIRTWNKQKILKLLTDSIIYEIHVKINKPKPTR